MQQHVDRHIFTTSEDHKNKDLSNCREANVLVYSAVNDRITYELSAFPVFSLSTMDLCTPANPESDLVNLFRFQQGAFKGLMQRRWALDFGDVRLWFLVACPQCSESAWTCATACLENLRAVKGELGAL